jgi:hypothetical protein
LKLIQRIPFNFTNCRVNFLFPYYHETIYGRRNIKDIEENGRTTILVCINLNESSVSAFMIIRTKEGDKIEMRNEIAMPAVRFIDYNYDLELRTVFLLCENPAFINQDGGSVTD